MYSNDIEQALKSRNIKVGDRIKLIKGKHTYEGLLLPRIELGDTSSIILKLYNGYNIGIKFDKNSKIDLLEKGKPFEFKTKKIELEKDSSKPNVSILGCGGTVASRIEYKTGAVFPAFSPSDLIFSFPELKDIANIDGRKLFDLLSEDMNPNHWPIIAKEAAKAIKDGKDGLVLMHGTDTMHYTAAALSFMLQNLPVPVVLVGAQRSSDRGSSDNQVNLICSALAAVKSNIAEVTVCMHGTRNDDFCYVHQGTKVRKLHTSRRDAFRSVNVSPYAKVDYDSKTIEYLRDDYKKRDKRNVKIDDKINPNVCLIQIHPGIKSGFVESLSNFYDGVVIMVTGIGDIPANPFKDKFAKSILPGLKSLIDSGVPVVAAPQTLFGRLNMNIYTTGRLLSNLGVIGNYCDWVPETALVKLMWVLGHTKDMDKVKEMMLTDYAGEVSKRSKGRLLD